MKAILANQKKKITGAASSIEESDLTAERALVSDSDGKVAASDVTSSELETLKRISVAIGQDVTIGDFLQQALMASSLSTACAGKFSDNNVLIADEDGYIDVSGISAAELEYLDGVTSNVQTQLDQIKTTADGAASDASTALSTAEAALPLAGGTMTGSLILSGDPTEDLEAATKRIVDSAASDASSALTAANSAASAVSELESALADRNVQVVTGSYTGEGYSTNYGSSHKNSLTFNSAARLVIISGSNACGIIKSPYGCYLGTSGSTQLLYVSYKTTSSSSTIQWYSSDSTTAQLNLATTYHYIAFLDI